MTSGTSFASLRRAAAAARFDPTLSMMRNTLLDPAFSKESATTRARIQQVHDFLDISSAWVDEMQRLDPATLMKNHEPRQPHSAIDRRRRTGIKHQKIENGPWIPTTKSRASSALSTLTNPDDGIVRWAPVKSLWLTSHALAAIIGGTLTFSLEHIAVFLTCTAFTLCLGHSLGMHRRLIHNSYECPRWLEYFFVHLGVIVGMAGPFGMIKGHDLRDWAQRQRHCHPYLRNGGSFLGDGWRQLHCDFHLGPSARVPV